MNTNIINLINDFAKNNRIGKARVEELVVNVISNCVPSSVKKNRIPKQKIQKTSRNDLHNFIKSEIVTMAKNFEVFSIVDVATKLSVSPYLVHRAVMECKNDNILKNVEKVENGKRGRKATMFMINS
jgi:hypothetical protein